MPITGFLRVQEFRRTIKKNVFLAALCAFCGSAYADGLADLKQALVRLQAESQISAVLDSMIVSQRGEDSDRVVKRGKVQVFLKDGTDGLQVTYSNEVMRNIEAEARAKIANEEAETPTLDALRELSATDFRTMLSAASSLERRLSQAQFVEETTTQYQGQPARVLHFTLPVESVINDKKTRGYVSKFESEYRVTIADDGSPLESHFEYRGKGRAYIVIRVEAFGSNSAQYQVMNGRLLRVRSEDKSGYSSTFGDGESVETYTLKPSQSAASTIALQP